MKAQRQHVQRLAAKRDRHPQLSHVTRFHPGGHVRASCTFCGQVVHGLAGLRERCPGRV